jgi:hypothetical protein
MKKTILSVVIAVGGLSLLFAATPSSADFCKTQPNGTVCVLPSGANGTCGSSDGDSGSVVGCYATPGQTGTTPAATAPAGTQPLSSSASNGAQSISGDEVCGATAATECTPAHLKQVGQRLLFTFTSIGGAVLLVLIAIRIMRSWYAYRAGNANAIKEAGQQAFNAVIGFFIVFAIMGGLYLAFLSYLGTQPWATQLFKLFSQAFIPHAYAAGETTDQLLPNAYGSNSLYDLLISGANLIMRFFVYPAIIAAWVWSGFQFVYARGNPEGLSKAKFWIFWAFIFTVVIFMLQGFLLAFRNSANSILGSTPSAFLLPIPESKGGEKAIAA